MLKEKDRNGNFIVSPFIFCSKKFNFYLSEQEFELLRFNMTRPQFLESVYVKKVDFNNINKIFDSMEEFYFNGEHLFFSLTKKQGRLLIKMLVLYYYCVAEEIINVRNLYKKKVKENVEEEQMSDDEGLIRLFFLNNQEE